MREYIDLSRKLNDLVSNPLAVNFGETHVLQEIPSNLSPFLTKPDKVVEMPPEITAALLAITAEYNQVFSGLVKENLEIPKAYQYAYNPETQEYINYGFQIDMRAIPESFFEILKDEDFETIKEVLKRCVFEWEDSFAMLNLLRMQFAENGESVFSSNFDKIFDLIRLTHGKPIALLPSTPEKFQSILESELGVQDQSQVTDAEIRKVLGYDTVLNPLEFQRMCEQGRGDDYLLYVRSSIPTANLRNPNLERPRTILDDPLLREKILENAITLNIGVLNDTKRGMLGMGLGLHVNSENFADSERITYLMRELCESYGLNTELMHGRFKPLDEAFGCYGHETTKIPCTGKSKQKVKKHLKEMGPYIIQPEMPTTQFELDGCVYNANHRNFVGFNLESQKYEPIDGTMFIQPHNDKARVQVVHGSRESIVTRLNMQTK